MHLFSFTGIGGLDYAVKIVSNDSRPALIGKRPVQDVKSDKVEFDDSANNITGSERYVCNFL